MTNKIGDNVKFAIGDKVCDVLDDPKTTPMIGVVESIGELQEIDDKPWYSEEVSVKWSLLGGSNVFSVTCNHLQKV